MAIGSPLDSLKQRFGIDSAYNMARDEYTFYQRQKLVGELERAQAEQENEIKKRIEQFAAQQAAKATPSPAVRKITADIVKTHHMYQVSLDELKVLWQLKFPDWIVKISERVVPGDEDNDEWYIAQSRLTLASAFEAAQTSDGQVLIRLK